MNIAPAHRGLGSRPVLIRPLPSFPTPALGSGRARRIHQDAHAGLPSARKEQRENYQRADQPHEFSLHRRPPWHPYPTLLEQPINNHL